MKPLRIATYNIHRAIGTDRRYSPARVAEVIREIDADIIGLQEVPLGGVARSGLDEIVDHVQGHHVSAPTVIIDSLPVGNAIISRFPLRLEATHDLSWRRRQPRFALDTIVSMPAHPLRVVATHFGLKSRERRHQAERLLETMAASDVPVVLMGDFNEWHAWGRPLKWLNAHFEQLPSMRTFPSRRPVFALDRIWALPRQNVLQVTAHRSRLARLASDHLPLVAEMRMPLMLPEPDSIADEPAVEASLTPVVETTT